MERINLNSNEKVAREVTGIESDAKHFVLNDKRADDILVNEAAQKFNTKVDEYVNDFNEHASKLQEFANYINDNVEHIEIMPIYNYALIKPFSENPFQRIVKSDSGIILDLGGQKPKFKNQDNGEVEEEEQFIHVGTVLEAGKECKYVKQGDTVMWTRVSEVPVPFYKQGLVLVNETRIMVVINENLKERFKKK